MPTKTICIANQKGGVGKTTTAVSLAHGLSQKGRRVLLIDLDPQGQCATALGRSPEPGAFYMLTMGATPQETTFVQSWLRSSGREGLYLLPGDQQTMAAQTVLNAQDQPISAIRNSISRFFKEGLHYIIFDTAPSVGGIQERAVWASDLVIVPTATEFLSADGVSKVLLMMSVLQEKKNWRGNLLGILPTFYDENTRESKATMEDLRERFDASVLPPIHRATLLRECAAQGQTIFEMDLLCRAAKEYQALTQLVMKF
ncbi:MAG: ParA family protein [Chloroflexi bacterium]|jgi:chromosome partitioning protein|nr:ParA family protein [Chloroflexota bacterium]MBI5704587.1 ParA family protein [Chloroflexota bacterium]GER78942.1 chromosome partitioning protein (ParA) family protein [Candidatus Denitrolinea symbiosum]